jgi:hypothetical protein
MEEHKNSNYETAKSSDFLTGGTSALEILHFLQRQYRYQDYIVSKQYK